MRQRPKVAFLCLIICVSLTACGIPARPFFNAKSSIFNSLEVDYDDVLSAEFNVYLSETADVLESATNGSYESVWLEKTLHLKRGTNVLYLAGDDRTCRMRCEIADLYKDKVIFAGFRSKD